MEGYAGADGGPQAAPLPAGVWIVDPAVQPLGVEPHRIGDPEDDPLSVLQDKQPLGLIPGVDRDVLAETERVELVHPGVVAPFPAPRAGNVAELREGLGVEGPALRAVLAGGGGTVERALALAPIEARQVPARQGGPVHAVPVHVTSARGEARVRDRGVLPRHLEDFGERGLRRIRARCQPEYRAGNP